RDQVIYYQYRAERARRTLHGIDEQVAKAERAVAGKAPVKRNRFIRLVGADKSVNRTLEAKARALAGWKGYTTNLATCPDGTPVTPEFVIDAYHRLFQIEASFRMSNPPRARRPIYPPKREPPGITSSNDGVVIGAAESPYTRRPDPTQTTPDVI